MLCRKPAIQLYLKPGHKIGKPSPLFTKIEQERLDELKKKYGGSQQTNGNGNAEQKKPEPTTVLKSVKEAEIAIAAQGEKVRTLKSSGAEKPIVQEQVNILLDLKKQLATLQIGSNEPQLKSKPIDTAKIAEIETQITQQGEKVRVLKTTAEKSVWQPELDKLLALKRELIAAGGTPAAPPPAHSKSKKKK